jgi:hypothetical protein
MSAGQYVPVVARKYKLPEQLVAAIVQVESGGDRFAMRHEPAYPWLWDVRAARDDECDCRASSAAIGFRRAAGRFGTHRMDRPADELGADAGDGCNGA